MRIRVSVLGVAAVSLVAAAPQGTQITVSDKYARPATLDVFYSEAEPLIAASIDPEMLAAEFKRLCIDTEFDPAKLDQVAPLSAWALKSTIIRNLPSRGVPAFEVDGWYGTAASARIWRTDPEIVRKLPWFVVDSGVVITGPQKPPVPQCNIDVKSTMLGDWPATVRALDQAIGSPGKPRNGKKWAQAEWSKMIGRRSAIIAIRVDGLSTPIQSVHVGIVPTDRTQF